MTNIIQYRLDKVGYISVLAGDRFIIYEQNEKTNTETEYFWKLEFDTDGPHYFGFENYKRTLISRKNIFNDIEQYNSVKKNIILNDCLPGIMDSIWKDHRKIHTGVSNLHKRLVNGVKLQWIIHKDFGKYEDLGI